MSASSSHRLPRPILVLMAALVVAAGCGDESPTAPPVPVSISLTPATATVDQGGTASLSASVSGASNSSVTWASTGGSLAAQGSSAVFTAPGSAGSFTVTATSVEDPSKSATATLTVPEIGISLSAGQPSLLRHERRMITATVTGTVNAGLTWTSDCGEIDGTGAAVEYVAPGVPGTCRVTASSTANPTRSSSVDLAVLRDLVVNSAEDEDDGRCDPEHCTLREAISTALGEGGADAERGIIRFAEGLGGEDLVLQGNLPALNQDLLIEGPGADLLTLDAGGTSAAQRRHFQIAGGARVEIRGMTLSGGFTSGSGGSILLWEGSHLDLVDARISGNTAGTLGGGLYLFQSTARLMRTEITDNEAGTGGGVYLREAEFEISDGLFARNVSPSSGGGLFIAFESEATVAGTDFEDNESGASGGGVFVGSLSTLQMDGGMVSGNAAASGGGLYMAFSDIDVRGVRVEDNEASVFGGGVLTAGPGVVRLERLVVARNSAGNGGGGLALGSTADLQVVNTTISGNSAGNGGAIRLTGVADLVNLTVANNVSANAGVGLGGAIFMAGTGYEARFSNVLMALNLTAGSPRNCSASEFLNATITSTGGNLSDDSSCADILDSSTVADLNATVSGIDPDLADHGGSTLTHALLAGSLAIDAGNPATCPSADQRGFARQGTCDIGAFEFGASSGALSLPRAGRR